MTTKSLAYRRIRAENCTTEGTIDLIVDPAKRKPANYKDGNYTQTTDVGYGRPECRRLTLGHFGENLVLADDAVDFIHVWRVVDLDEGRPKAQLCGQLLRDTHPVRFGVIAGLWADAASLS